MEIYGSYILDLKVWTAGGSTVILREIILTAMSTFKPWQPLDPLLTVKLLVGYM